VTGGEGIIALLYLRTPGRQLSSMNIEQPYGGHFSGDPLVLGYLLTPTEDDIIALKRDQWLSTHLLDLIVQRPGIRPDMDVDPFAPLLGSLGAETYISSMNLTASLKRDHVKKIEVWKSNQESIKQLREKLKLVMQQPASTNGKSYCLIVPLVNLPGEVGHFFVGCFDFSMHWSSFFTHVSFYDSLEQNARRVVRGSTAAKLVQKVNTFVNNFVLHLPKHHHLQQSDGAVLQTVFYQSCPEQQNGFDCGLFAVAVCLHLAERKPVDPNSFAQCNVTKARRLLSHCLGVNTVIDVDNEELETTSTYFRGCFPLLSSSGKFENSAQGVPPRMATTRKSTPSKTRNIRAAGGSQKKKIAVKKVKRESKVKTNSYGDIVVDENGTTEVKLTKVVPKKSPIRKAIEEEHNECDNASIDSLASEEMEVLLQQAIKRILNSSIHVYHTSISRRMHFMLLALSGGR
jgi:hypothetical protein